MLEDRIMSGKGILERSRWEVRGRSSRMSVPLTCESVVGSTSHIASRVCVTST